MGSARRWFVLAAGPATAIALLAGCGHSSTPPTASVSLTVSQAATVSPAGTATASPGSTPAAFVPITEPFDPGHPARTISTPATCGSQTTTLGIEQCFEDKAETADAAIDAVQQASFASASPAQQEAINTDDASWLAARAKVCALAYQTGGTIDGINIASCLFSESTARLDALRDIAPAEQVLLATDNTSLSALSYYTTPEGSRIAMIETQGDETGGSIVAWVVIAGSAGFVVNPAQFYYSDGTFTDAGIVQGSVPADYRVAPGTEYQFDIDYSTLSQDPNENKGSGGWVYAPGTPVAVWR